MKNRTLTIPKTKNKTTLVLPLVGECYEIIKALCSQKHNGEYIFPSHNWDTYRSAFEWAVKRANIPDFSFHKLRATSASYMIQDGIPLYVVGAVLGHRNPASITFRYAHLDTSNLKGALETLAERLKE